MKGRLLGEDRRDRAPQVPGRCGWFSVSSMTVMMAYSCISRWSGALGVCAIVAIFVRPMPTRAVVELFTSQDARRPLADKIIGELVKILWSSR
jgi:hypothetical protein